MEKSANKKWKESGTSLSFKEWIDRENKKQESGSDTTFLPFDASQQVQDSYEDVISQTDILNVRTEEDKNKILGLDKRIFVFSSVIILGSLSFYFYSKLKKK
jgi:hypothetical protein